MATEIDALQLNFTASTSKADTSIDKLVERLDSLGKSINMFNNLDFITKANNIVQSLTEIKSVADNTNSANLKEIASGVRSLANSVKNLPDGNSIGIFFTNLSNGINSLNGTNIDVSQFSLLFNSISKLGSGNVVNAGESLGKIADGLRQFQGINLPTFQGLESFTAFLRGLGSKTIVAASGAIGQLASGLRQFDGLTVNVGEINGITELAQTISVFGRKSSQSAATTIPTLANGLRQLFSTLASVPNVSQNVIDLTNALASFVANLRNVNPASTQATRGLNLFGNAAHRTSRRTFSLASAIGKVYATYFLLFRAFGKIKDAIDISADLTEVQNVVDTSFGQMTDRVEEFAKSSVRNFGLSELSAKRYASRFQAMGVAMAIPAKSISEAQKQLNSINPVLADRGYSNVADSMADISLNLTKLTADMASFYNVTQEDVAKDLESVFTGSTRPLNLAA